MLQPLDGPSAQTKLSVTTATVVEAKVGGSVLDERKVLTIQPLDGRVYIYFGDGGAAPSAATVAAAGFVQYKNAINTYEASASQAMYLLGQSGTTNVIIVERA